MRTLARVVLGIILSALSINAYSATRTWTGAGGNPFWSTPANWGGVAPAPGDDLVFPTGAAQLTNNNDFVVAFGNILISGSGYLLQGAQINVTNGITATYTSGTSRVHAQITVLGAQTFSVAAGGTLRISTGINMFGTLTLGGDGDYLIDGVLSSIGAGVVKTGAGTLTLSNDNTFTGGLTVQQGTVLANDPPGGNNATGPGTVTVAYNGGVNRATLGGTGSVGNVNVTSGTITGGTVVDPTLNTGNLNLTAFGGEAQFFTVSPTVSQQISVNGTVTVTDAAFNFGFTPPATTPVPGTLYLLISNDGTDPIVGQFFNRPEGNTFNLSGQTFRLSYVGGDGNDLTLLATEANLGVTKTVNNASPAVGQNVTFTITVSNAGPTSATGVTLTDTLPAGLAFVSANASQGSCSGTGPVTCALGTIANAGTATVTLVATATATGPRTNTATVTSNDADPVSANNTATSTVTAATSGPNIPALDPRALVALAVMIAVIGALALRR